MKCRVFIPPELIKQRPGESFEDAAKRAIVEHGLVLTEIDDSQDEDSDEPETD